MGNYCCSAPCNSPCGEYANEVTMEENFNRMIREEDLTRDVNDGDIILFKSNRPNINKKAQKLSSSVWTEFDHVALVVRAKSCADDFLLLEATAFGTLRLIKWSNVRLFVEKRTKFGGSHPFTEVTKSASKPFHAVYFRKVNMIRTKRGHDALLEFAE
mgnify:FL=1